jgi:hypothetical protein
VFTGGASPRPWAEAKKLALANGLSHRRASPNHWYGLGSMADPRRFERDEFVTPGVFADRRGPPHGPVMRGKLVPSDNPNLRTESRRSCPIRSSLTRLAYPSGR